MLIGRFKYKWDARAADHTKTDAEPLEQLAAWQKLAVTHLVSRCNPSLNRSVRRAISCITKITVNKQCKPIKSGAVSSETTNWLSDTNLSPRQPCELYPSAASELQRHWANFYIHGGESSAIAIAGAIRIAVSCRMGVASGASRWQLSNQLCSCISGLSSRCALGVDQLQMWYPDD